MPRAVICDSLGNSDVLQLQITCVLKYFVVETVLPVMYKYIRLQEFAHSRCFKITDSRTMLIVSTLNRRFPLQTSRETYQSSASLVGQSSRLLEVRKIVCSYSLQRIKTVETGISPLTRTILVFYTRRTFQSSFHTWIYLSTILFFDFSNYQRHDIHHKKTITYPKKSLTNCCRSKDSIFTTLTIISNQNSSLE